MADGILFYYCKKCGARIPHEDINEGLAYVLSDENSALCSECVRDNPVPQATPIIDDVSDTRKALPVATVTPASGRSPRQTGRLGAPAAAPQISPRLAMAALIAGAVMVIASVVIFLLPRRYSEPKPNAEIAATHVEPAWPENINTTKSAHPSDTTATRTDTATDTKKGDDLPKDTPKDPEAPAEETTLLKLSADDFKGGKVLNNLWGKGRSARSIYGAQTKDPSMSASFDLKATPEGAASLLVDTIKHGASDPCHISISLNGHEIFQGSDPAASGAVDEWIQHRFLVDARILHADRNEIRFSNLENSAATDGPPYYIISSIEIRTKTP